MTTTLTITTKDAGKFLRQKRKDSSLRPNSRFFTNQARYQQKEGKTFLVVPGVPVQEQVMNTYLLPAEEIEKSLLSWNGTPLCIRHAQANGGSVQVEKPDVPIIGFFDNAVWDPKGKRMLGDYWIDVEEANKHPEGITIIESIKNGQIVETSTAYWADEEWISGAFRGRRYTSIHRNPKRDHIAIFPNDQLGACSVNDGCGVNRNMQHNAGCSCKAKHNELAEFQKGHLPTSMLIGYALNKGSRTQEQLDSMRERIAKSGITKKVWIKRKKDGKICILDGNHRVHIANELNIEQIPVIALDEGLHMLDLEAVYREWLYQQDQEYLQ